MSLRKRATVSVGNKPNPSGYTATPLAPVTTVEHQNLAQRTPQEYIFNGWKPIGPAPVALAWYDTTPDSGRTIRRSTQAEYDALANHLFGQYSGAAQDAKMEAYLASFKLYGRPIYTISDSKFVSVWWLDGVGPCVCTFVGYGTSSPPTQEVSLTVRQYNSTVVRF